MPAAQNVEGHGDLLALRMMRLRWLPILVAACVALAGCSASGDAAGAQKKDRLPDGVQVETAP